MYGGILNVSGPIGLRIIRYMTPENFKKNFSIYFAKKKAYPRYLRMAWDIGSTRAKTVRNREKC